MSRCTLFKYDSFYIYSDQSISHRDIMVSGVPTAQSLVFGTRTIPLAPRTFFGSVQPFRSSAVRTSGLTTPAAKPSRSLTKVTASKVCFRIVIPIDNNVYFMYQ